MTEYDEKKCKADHHPWMDCPHCEHCGEAHCSLNASAHVVFESWQALEPPTDWPK